MRAGRLGQFAAMVLLVVTSACSRGVKADFPRPPATVSIPRSPEPKPEPPPEETASAEIAPPAEKSEPESEPEPPKSEPKPTPARREAPVEPAPVAEPEPPSTQLASGVEADPEVVSKLERADSLLTKVGTRPLSQQQKEQVNAARGFVTQAHRALDDGDERRALVLVDKGLILAEDVERTSR